MRTSNVNFTLRKAVAAAFVALAVAQPASAVLQRQGPVDPATKFPAWFQDRNGVALELCTINSPDPAGLAVVNAGLCAIVKKKKKKKKNSPPQTPAQGTVEANHAAADRIERAVTRTLEQGYRTPDIHSEGTPGAQRVGTQAMGDAVVKNL